MQQPLIFLFCLLGTISYSQTKEDTTYKEFNYRLYRPNPCAPCFKRKETPKPSNTITPYKYKDKNPIIIKDSAFIEWLKEEKISPKKTSKPIM